ncbi:PH domain-containing protein [Longispora sp. K20-0274]|uniref:PH domain-containing protein n=1 Tax=Longispora sp. K20-0274 TaxID=3088255 RepID=UPI003999C608
MFTPRFRPDDRDASPYTELVDLALTLAALVAGLVVVAVRLVMGPDLPRPTIAVLLVGVTVLVGVVVFRNMALHRLGGRAPARFLVREDAFVVGPYRYARFTRSLGGSVYVAWQGTIYVPTQSRVVTCLWLVVLVLSATGLVVTWLRPSPWVTLTAAGVEFRTLFRTRFAPWDDITAVKFMLAIRVRDRWWSVADGRLDVRTGYVSDAIGYYRGHPERRHLIGTVAEHDRLYRELSEIFARRIAGTGPAQPWPVEAR